MRHLPQGGLCRSVLGHGCARSLAGRARLRGFTLLELLMAMIALAVLAAFAAPLYTDYRDRVRLAQAVIDIQALGARIKQFEVEQRRLPADLGEVGAAAQLDPWGRPYEYTNLTTIKGKGKARKDGKLNPINSDFDLYSQGKDGKSVPSLKPPVSRDDVVRAADGRFVGLAAQFDP